MLNVDYERIVQFLVYILVSLPLLLTAFVLIAMLALCWSCYYIRIKLSNE